MISRTMHDRVQGELLTFLIVFPVFEKQAGDIQTSSLAYRSQFFRIVLQLENLGLHSLVLPQRSLYHCSP